jgi:hypothetical protein
LRSPQGFSSSPGPLPEQYPGWGDTGWVHAGKRERCNAAIDIAAEYSAQACVTAGGVPRPFRRCLSARHLHRRVDGGRGEVLYRCYGEASVWCR